ncbi:hypothetical protein NHX12_027037, partial [Muraenolepis orangiensis]
LQPMFAVNLTLAKPMRLILAVSSPHHTYAAYSMNTDVHIYASSNSNTTFHGPANIHKEDLPADPEKLVDWAKQKFGGVTSFTTLRNPIKIDHTGREGTRLGSGDCVMEYEDQSLKHFMELTGSMGGSMGGEAEIHIINIPDSASLCNVSVHVDSEKAISLFLRGPQGTIWSFHNPRYTKLGLKLKPSDTLTDDSALAVQKRALEYFKAKSFTSYSEIQVKGSMIALMVTPKDPPAHQAPEVSTLTTTAMSHVPLLMQLFTAPDYRSALEPSTKVQSDKRVYAEISMNPLGSIVLTIRVISCSVRSQGLCPVVKGMPFILEECSPGLCPNSTRLSFSLEHLQELASTTWDLECSVKFCFSEKHQRHRGGKVSRFKGFRDTRKSPGRRMPDVLVPLAAMKCWPPGVTIEYTRVLTDGWCERCLAPWLFRADLNLQSRGSSPQDRFPIDDMESVFINFSSILKEVFGQLERETAPCCDFGLPAVLGVAFGGFLIGALLIGALWVVKIKTGYPTRLDVSATAMNLTVALRTERAHYRAASVLPLTAADGYRRLRLERAGLSALTCRLL